MNDDIFKRWGIEHLSPSSINLYIASPLLWIIRYIMKIQSLGSPAMWRGNAVDKAVGSYFGLHHEEFKPKSITQVQTQGLKQFDDDVYLASQKIKEKDKKADDNTIFERIPVEKFKIERELLPRYIKTAIDHYKNFDQADSYQEKVMYEMKGLPIPIIGYIDLKYEKDGVVRDIKTSGRSVSALSNSVSRQLALYGHCTGMLPLADYIVCNKSKSDVVSLEVANVKASLDELERGALAIKKLLSISDDIQDMTSLFVPDFDNFRFSELKDDKEVLSILKGVK
tara:strand:+ start:1024 stop:1869 length:846 start_codon:yes stop_codon:yes gene_type:complete